MSIQPVIIDSSMFNTENKKNLNQQLSPALKIPLGGGSSFKTQKFSKIQLQAIIDNLYQYDSKAGS